jgi:hypothetical protein
MKVWTNRHFEGHYPVGTAAVVVADSAEQAAELLNDACEKEGLGRPATAEQFERLPTAKPYARILCDGDY